MFSNFKYPTARSTPNTKLITFYFHIKVDFICFVHKFYNYIRNNYNIMLTLQFKLFPS